MRISPVQRALVLASIGSLTACPTDLVPLDEGSTGATGTTGAAGLSETGVVSESADAGDPVTTTAAPTGTSTSDATDASTAGLDDTGALASTGSESSTSTTGEPAESSSTGDSSGAASSSETGDPGLCGNGVLEADEQCDDGDADPDDQCANDCTLGPADLGQIVPLALLPAEDPTCFAIAGDGVAVAGKQFIPDPKQLYAHIQQVPLPAGAPVGWSFHEKAGQYGRWPQQAATASNGDLIIAGQINTEIVKVDTGGYLWLARFTAAGELVWNLETKSVGIAAHGLALSPTDDIVVIGKFTGLGNPPPTAAAFTGDGLPLWEFDEPYIPQEYAYYTSVAVGDDGVVYIAGYADQEDMDGLEIVGQRMLLRALTPAGAPLWLHEQAADPLGVYPGSLVLTTDDRLVLSVRTFDLDTDEWSPDRSLAAFDTAGNPLWTKLWQAPAPWQGYGQLLASEDGGVYVAGGAVTGEDTYSTFTARFTADGSPLWMKLAPGRPAIDAVLAPDSNLLLLTDEAIIITSP